MVEGWRILRAEDAVGRRAAHDITAVSAAAKGPIVRRGEVITESHLRALKEAGHDYVAVIEPGSGPADVVWEDEAVVGLARAVAGEGVEVRYAGEGKAFIHAARAGYLSIDPGLMESVNSSTDFRIMSRRRGSWVSAGDLVAIVELIPLYVPRADFSRALGIARGSVSVKPSLGLRAWLVVTGTEVYEGRVRDLAEGAVRPKLELYGCSLAGKVIVPDDERAISAAVSEAASRNDLVIVTGGMSVDPTDVTPRAILATGARLVIYGFPVKPTTMSMLAYLNGKPVIGVSSGIVHFSRENVLDILLPRICTGGSWSREELASLGDGGIMESFIAEVGRRGR
ncbi:MAG: molybdopterin-binding protein [Conexivisphaera sp.]